MKRFLLVAVMVLGIISNAFAYGQITHEYGFYQDTKSKKVFRMFCDLDTGYFTERIAIKKGGVWVSDPDAHDRGYMSGSCSATQSTLNEFVKKGNLKRVQ